MLDSYHNQLMNPTFSSPRNITKPPFLANHPPFYNPQNKDSNPNSIVPPSKPVAPFMHANQHPSKSYHVKNAQHPKITSNSSAYLKSPLDTANSSGGFNGYSGNYTKIAGQMSKSSFHDQPRMAEMPANFPRTVDRVPTGTPPRRQPRFSEPGNMEHPFDLAQDTKGSVIPFTHKASDKPKQESRELHFQKKGLINSTELHKPESKISGFQKASSFGSGFLPKKTKKVSLDSFEMVRNLGKGKYGQVFLARQKATGFMCALKVIQKAVLIEENIVEQFIREVKIQIFLNHPNIIKMHGLFDDKQHIYIILEMALGGQLYQQMKKSEPMPEVKAIGLMKQICTAVEQLHSNRIIHRDIKPQNIVMHEGVVKLCDFGWSVHLDNKMRTTFCGTPLYVCPQILKGNQYDQKIDIWSIGIMMYELLVGESPFKINTQEELIKIVKDQISIPSYVFVSRQARDFLDKCLQKNPNDRVTIKQLSNHIVFAKNAEKQKAEKKLVM